MGEKSRGLVNPLVELKKRSGQVGHQSNMDIILVLNLKKDDCLPCPLNPLTFLNLPLRFSDGSTFQKRVDPDFLLD